VKKSDLSVRQVALHTLDRFDEGEDTASDLLHRALESQKGWGARERAQLTDLVMGTIRWRGRIDWILSGHALGFPRNLSPRVHNVLRMGVFQLCFSRGVPSFAAVSEAVNLARGIYRGRLAAYVNAVMRAVYNKGGCLRLPDPTGGFAEYLAAAYSFPPWVVRHRLALLGEGGAEELCSADNVVAPLNLRTNTLLTSRDELMADLKDEFQQIMPCAYAPEGFLAHGALRSVDRMPAFQNGLFYVQDEAAQLIAHLAGVLPGEQVLDACAAPGGKTTHMAQLMGNTGRIVALDVNAARLAELGRNCKRMGIRIVEAAAGDLLALQKDRSPGSFDMVLLDPPCSSLGVIRRHPDIKWRRRADEIPALADVQRRMIRCAAGMVRPGGRLVYAVCTTTPEEGEDVVRDFLSARSDFSLQMEAPAAGWEKLFQGGIFRTFPHRHGMDAFFAARFRRSEA